MISWHFSEWSTIYFIPSTLDQLEEKASLHKRSAAHEVRQNKVSQSCSLYSQPTPLNSLHWRTRLGNQAWRIRNHNWQLQSDRTFRLSYKPKVPHCLPDKNLFDPCRTRRTPSYLIFDRNSLSTFYLRSKVPPLSWALLLVVLLLLSLQILSLYISFRAESWLTYLEGKLVSCYHWIRRHWPAESWLCRCPLFGSYTRGD